MLALKATVTSKNTLDEEDMQKVMQKAIRKYGAYNEMGSLKDHTQD